MRLKARRDANHVALKAAFEGMGCDVWDFASTGGGVADLYVAAFGIQFWCEVKDGDKPPSARRLTRAEEQFRAFCIAAGVRYAVVESVDDAERLVEALRHIANEESEDGQFQWLN